MPANVAPEHIVRRPVLSEKSTSVMNDQKRYTFEVETIYKVRVIGINTTLRQARTRTTKSGKVDGTITKKAVIRLHADDAIELF